MCIYPLPKFWLKKVYIYSWYETYYALLLEYFGIKFLPHIRHCVYWVLTKIWAPNSSHRICNKFFIHHCQRRKEGSFVCETVLILSLGKYSSIWPEICRVLSQIQSRFLRGISEKKKLFREKFSEVLLKTKAILYWNS